MRKTILTVFAIATTGFAGFVLQTFADPDLGYTDTPMLPSGKWHVHDPDRPRPVVVTPGASFSQGAAAPSDAIILFNGKDLSHWEGEKGDPQWITNGECKGLDFEGQKTAPQWTLHGNYMQVKPDTGYIHTKEKFGDFQLHLEFAEPAKVSGDSQERGNSGVFLQGIYEIQVLDTYNNPTYPDGQCGGIYGQSTPLVNACKKPGQWQTYDIVFEAARWSQDHKLVRPAIVTVFQNGLLIHYKQPIIGPTGHRVLAEYDKELPATGPLRLQDHGDPIRYRNIWIRNIQEEEKP